MTDPQDPKEKAAIPNEEADLSALMEGAESGDISEDDLLADFSDILSEPSAGEGAQAAGDEAGPAAGSDTAIDELEAFLDEFEEHLAAEESSGTVAEPSAAEPENTPEVTVDDAFAAAEEPEAAEVAPASPEMPAGEELQEAFLEEAAVTEVAEASPENPLGEELEESVPEGAAVGEVDEGAGDEPPSEPQAVPELPGEELELAAVAEVTGIEAETEAAEPPVLDEGGEPFFEPLEEVPLELNEPAPAAVAAAQPPEPAMAPISGGAAAGGGGWINMAAIVLAVLGIAGAGGAAWLGFSLSGQIRHVTDQLQLVQAAESDDGRLDRVMADMDRLNERLDELAVIIEGPVGHLRESNKRELEALQARIDKTEESLNGLRESLALVEQRVSEGGVRILKARRTEPGRGHWAVNLASLSDPKTADEELRNLRKQGIPAEKHAVTMDGKTWYRLRVTGFASAGEARAYGESLVAKTGLTDTWLSHP